MNPKSLVPAAAAKLGVPIEDLFFLVEEGIYKFESAQKMHARYVADGVLSARAYDWLMNLVNSPAVSPLQ